MNKAYKTYRHKGKVIGELGTDGVFRKETETRFIMRKFHAFGLDADMFDELPPGTEIRVRLDRKDVYTITKEKADEIKIVGEFSDFGRQIFIKIEAFTLT